MMKKTIKLKKNYEFNEVFKRGNCIGEKLIICFYKKTNLPYNSIGIAIQSKLGNAVKRNKIKRFIREAYRTLESKIEVGYSFVFLWNKKIKIEEGNYQQIIKDMKKIFQKIGIDHEESNDSFH